jgi:hypothetical protein
VPLGTLGPGGAGDAARGRLVATAAHGAGWWPPRARTVPTAGATALAAAATFGAILGWPPLVAALIAGAGGEWGWNMLTAVALGCAAFATATIAAGVAAAGGSRDTALALALAVALAVVAVASQKNGPTGESPPTPGGTDVERSVRSCKTP